MNAIYSDATDAAIVAVLGLELATIFELRFEFRDVFQNWVKAWDSSQTELGVNGDTKDSLRFTLDVSMLLKLGASGTLTGGRAARILGVRRKPDALSKETWHPFLRQRVRLVFVRWECQKLLPHPLVDAPYTELPFANSFDMMAAMLDYIW